MDFSFRFGVYWRKNYRKWFTRWRVLFNLSLKLHFSFSLIWIGREKGQRRRKKRGFGGVDNKIIFLFWVGNGIAEPKFDFFFSDLLWPDSPKTANLKKKKYIGSEIGIPIQTFGSEFQIPILLYMEIPIYSYCFYLLFLFNY